MLVNLVLGLHERHPHRAVLFVTMTVPLRAATPVGIIPRLLSGLGLLLISPFGPRSTKPSASFADAGVTRGRPATRLGHHTWSSTEPPLNGSPRTAPSCAINGITDNTLVKGARASIGAPSAVKAAITHASAPKLPYKIRTPLSSSSWSDALLKTGLSSEFPDIISGLQHGFKTGVSSSITTTYIPPNHWSALDNPDAVSSHISKELALHRYSGPFSPSELESLIGPFRCAPLGVVPKPNSSKLRIIQDLSFPRNDPTICSVNSEINSDDFPCEWGTFAQCYFLVAKSPPGTEVAVFDVDSAYRNVPIRPEDQNHFCVSWKDKVSLRRFRIRFICRSVWSLSGRFCCHNSKIRCAASS